LNFVELFWNGLLLDFRYLLSRTFESIKLVLVFSWNQVKRYVGGDAGMHFWLLSPGSVPKLHTGS